MWQFYVKNSLSSKTNNNKKYITGICIQNWIKWCKYHSINNTFEKFLFRKFKNNLRAIEIRLSSIYDIVSSSLRLRKRLVFVLEARLQPVQFKIIGVLVVWKLVTNIVPCIINKMSKRRSKHCWWKCHNTASRTDERRQKITLNKDSISCGKEV